MNPKKTLGVALVALMSMAFASSASATTVTPANTSVTATLQEGTHLYVLPKNAYSTLFIECQEAEFTFRTPTDDSQPAGSKLNQNQIGVGTFSEGAGSVIMDSEGTGTVGDCVTSDEREAIVTTNEDNGAWTAAALAIEDPPFELDTKTIWDGVIVSFWPADSAEISIPTLGLTIVLSPGRSSGITAVYDNETSKLRIDGQFFQTPGSPVLQYEGEFDVDSGFEINF